MSAEETTSKVHVNPAEARRFVEGVLTGNGVPKDSAQIIARCLIEADLRGVDTHGANRLPSYMKRIRSGVMDPAARPVLKAITPVVFQVDGQNSFGFLSATLAMEACIKAAKTYGIAMCSVQHSNHFGMSASYALRAAEADMMSMVFTNSSPAMPVWGGREKLMGVSPICAGAPAAEGGVPFIMDLTPSVAARGKVYRALRRNEKIPLDWALDKQGRATDDPAEALEGVMLPIGGPKGSALSVWMDIFSGVLSESAFAGGVVGPYDPNAVSDVGHFIMAIKPDLFVTMDGFKARMTHLYNRVVGAERAERVERIYFPGEVEIDTQKTREQFGIPWTRAEIDALNAEAEVVGAAHLVI